MRFPEHDHVVETFPSDRADHFARQGNRNSNLQENQLPNRKIGQHRLRQIAQIPLSFSDLGVLHRRLPD